MPDLKKFKVEIELCGPNIADANDVYEYIYALVKESDFSSLNDIFAIGEIKVIEGGEITMEEWNGDPVEEIDLEELK